jgi:hypothetical protein
MGPASPDLQVAASDDGWLSTPVAIPLTRTVTLAFTAAAVVVSTSDVVLGSGAARGDAQGSAGGSVPDAHTGGSRPVAVVRPWRPDIRQRRLERTLLKCLDGVSIGLCVGFNYQYVVRFLYLIISMSLDFYV